MSIWKKLDKVTIVYKNKYYSDDLLGYIVETGNKSQLKSAISWAGINPKIVETENEGFSFEIISSAGGSSCGGKLSFWTCRIEKNGIEPFYVGINADLLVEMIRESTLINGKTQEKVFFARQGGNLGVLHENMEEYRQFIKDQEFRKTIKAGKKTSKWQAGWTYQTLTESDIMFGYYPRIATTKYEREYKGYMPISCAKVTTLDFDAKEKPVYYRYNDGDTYNDIVENLCKPFNVFHDKCPNRMTGTQIFTIGEDYFNLFEKELLNVTKKFFAEQYYYMGYIADYAFMPFKIDPNITIHILELVVSLFTDTTEDKLKEWGNTSPTLVIKHKNQEYCYKKYKDYYQKLLDIAREEKLK